MRYLSLFSGIEACSVAWEGLGWKPVAFSEIDDFPCAVLKYHYPNVPNLGDVTKIDEAMLSKLGDFELLVGGSPCQDLSVAGMRAGLKDKEGNLTRSGLFDHQIRIFELARNLNGCRFMLWENVSGALSSNQGRDFAYILGQMVGGEIPVPRKGWANAGICLSPNADRIVEWRILDAEFFGVPQIRRRLFCLLDVGRWWSRPPVLFESEGGSWNSEKSELERKKARRAARNRTKASSKQKLEGAITFKARSRDSQPQYEKMSPVTATDYKEPDIVCYWSKNNENENCAEKKCREDSNIDS